MNSDSQTLCDVCKSLNLSLDKFVITSEEESTRVSLYSPFPGQSILSGTFDPTGLQTLKLGHLNDIYRKRNCPFCRLVFEATRGDNISEIGVDGLSRNGKRVMCYMAWELDAREPDMSSSTARSVSMDVKTRRIRVFSPSNAFPAAHIALLGDLTEASSYLGRRASSTQTSIDLIRKWLKTCETHHKAQCWKPDETLCRQSSCGFRLIDVHTLSIVAASLTASRFVALSYVWGSARIDDALKINNLQQMAAYGFFNSMDDHIPRTIRDTIALTLALGERYLWVDLYCIIQDSAEDVTENIQMMDVVYGKAILTVCAAAGSDFNYGLPGFKPQSRELLQPIETIADLQLIVLRPVEAYIKQSPWSSRSWTFQERLLSKRCLLFTQDRVFYQCQEAVWSEETNSELPHKAWTLDHVGSPLALFNENPLKRYSAFVELFTARKLTYLADKLNAFAGILKSLENPLCTSFSWGLPASYFDWALLWEPKERLTRVPDFPSWSWAGWDGQTGWKLSTVSGALGNLHEWLSDRTWIVWCKENE